MIANFKPGDVINSKFLLRQFKITENKAKTNTYGDVTLGDKSGAIMARMWNVNNSHAQIYPEGSIVRVNGIVDTWEGKMQVIINNMVVDGIGEDLINYIYRPTQHPNDMLDTIFEYINKITNQTVSKLVKYCVDMVKEKLLYYPAGKINHHAYYSGLLLHMTNMLKSADLYLQNKPYLNDNYIYGGIIIHDLGKVYELDYNPLTEPSYNMTGALAGHIGIGVSILTEAAIRSDIPLSDVDFEQLRHIILSHHGKLEYGSPILPRTPEAVLVHLIDGLDATMQAVEDSIRICGNDILETGKIGMLNNRTLYVSESHKQFVKQHHGLV